MGKKISAKKIKVSVMLIVMLLVTALTLTFVLSACKSADPVVEFYSEGKLISKRVVEHNKLVLPDEPTKEGCFFGGWFNDEGFTIPFDKAAFEAGTKAKLTKLYAKFSANKYKISLQLNGGIGGSVITEYNVGVELTLPKNFTRDTAIFGGWYASSTFESNTRVEKILATDSGDKTFWAKWIYAVSLHTNGGVGGTNMTEYAIGIETTLPRNFTKQYNTFQGWYDNSTFDGEQIKSISSSEFGSKEFFAKWMPDSYAVDLVNGGSGSELARYTYGVGAELPKDWTKVGHTFGGWFDNTNCEGTPVTRIGTTETGSKAFWGKWTANVYSVTLLPNGGSRGTDIKQYTFGLKVVLPVDWEKNEVKFGGWFDNPELQGKPITEISTTDFGSKIYYARWTDNEYTVTLNKNGGTGGTELTKYTFGVGALLPKDWKKIGYTFIGWFDNSGFTGLPIEAITNYDAGNLTFWAKFSANKYSVTLVGNDGSGPLLTEYTYGVNAELSADWTKAGHTFEGWFDNKDFTESPITNISIGTMGEKTFYAKFTPNTYLVTLELNDGVGGTELTEYTYGVGATLPADWTKEHYTFAGWYLTADYSGNAVTHILVNDLEDKIFYAKWAPNKFAVTLHASGGTIGTDLIEYTYGAGAVLPTDWTRFGHTLSGWFLDSGFGGSPVTEISIVDFGNKEFWAKWTPRRYDVTLNTNGGVGGTELLDYYYGNGAELPKDWLIEGYDFAGWYDNVDLIGSAITHILPTDTGSKEFWAKYTLKKYNVSLMNTDGAVGLPLTEYTYKTGAELPTNWTKDGYDFDGWYIESDYSGTAVTHILSTDIGNKTYYAKWAVRSYTVTLNINGGTGGTPLTQYTFGNEVTLPTGYSRDTASFGGWYTTENFAIGTSVTKISSTDFGDKIFYAKWIYTVTLNANGGNAGSALTEYAFSVGATLPTDWVDNDGTELAGWSTTAAGDGEWVDAISATDFGNKVLYAQYGTKGLEYTLVGGTSYSVTSYTGSSLDIKFPVFYKGKTVASIGENAFSGKSITSVALPSGLKSIGNYAFANCLGLEKIFIPSSVATMGANVFDSCSSLLVYCGADAPPSGWDTNWSTSVTTSNIFWGQTSAR